jgi:hypothetical protein
LTRPTGSDRSFEKFARGTREVRDQVAIVACRSVLQVSDNACFFGKYVASQKFTIGFLDDESTRTRINFGEWPALIGRNQGCRAIGAHGQGGMAMCSPGVAAGRSPQRPRFEPIATHRADGNRSPRKMLERHGGLDGAVLAHVAQDLHQGDHVYLVGYQGLQEGAYIHLCR